MGVTINLRCMQQSTRKVIAIAAIITVLAGIAYASYEVVNVQLQVPDLREVPTATPQALASGSESVSVLAPETPRPKLLIGPSRARESKALEFEIASTSRDPSARFKAYELVHDCVVAHVLSEPIRTETWLPGRLAEPLDPSACGDLKPGQWEDVQRRHTLLREASLAGVHGAWFRVWQEGPSGPLRSLADGPEYQAWEALAREAALKTGDPFVYAQEAQEWRDKDRPRALVATVIYREMLTYRQGGTSFDPSVDPEVVELASTLEKSTAANAVATGRAFVANAIKPK